MLGIYADMMKTATRTNCLEVHEVPSKTNGGRRRWFSRTRKVCIDPMKL